MSTLHLNPHFIIPLDIKGQNEWLHAGENEIVYVYRDVHFIKLELMDSREVQEIAISVIDGIARVTIGLLCQQEQDEENEVEIDATLYIGTQIDKKIKEIEILIPTTPPKIKDFSFHSLLK